ncbi:hypothetical protein AVEN_104961-1, partial [Araneus ventricosus]
MSSDLPYREQEGKRGPKKKRNASKSSFERSEVKCVFISPKERIVDTKGRLRGFSSAAEPFAQSLKDLGSVFCSL